MVTLTVNVHGVTIYIALITYDNIYEHKVVMKQEVNMLRFLLQL